MVLIAVLCVVVQSITHVIGGTRKGYDMALDKKYGRSGIPDFIDIALMRRQEETLHWFRHMADMTETSVVGRPPEACLDDALDKLRDFEEDDKNAKGQETDDHNR